MIKLFLFDIEGTTTDINFVHNMLFPYSLENIEAYVMNNLFSPPVKNALEMVYETVNLEDKKTISVNEAILYLKKWIKEDRKHPGLKLLQGLIWENGYVNEDFKGHIYSDVEPFFKKIKSMNTQIGIYSSGSVQAQKLIFGYSVFGDMKKYIDFYFDTKVGHKREVKSYENISSELKISSHEIHFFSDIIQELEAAKSAGFETTHLQRENYQGETNSMFKSIKSFDEFKI
jgi:enolase-phosphatase E1